MDKFLQSSLTTKTGRSIAHDEVALMNRSLVVTSVVFTGFFLCVSLKWNSQVPAPWKDPLLAYLACPVLMLLLLRMNPMHYGLGIGNWRKGLWLSFLASIAVLLSCYLFAKVPAMQFYYSSPKWVAGDPETILLGECRRLKTLIGWEFLFRGFLLFPLHEALGPAANLIQATLCAIMHKNKPLVEFYGSFPFALLLGYLARKSRSVWYGVYVHWLLGVSLEVYVAIAKGGLIPFW
jgi:membrane protease YdiL (CAAX protease family)